MTRAKKASSRRGVLYSGDLSKPIRRLQPYMLKGASGSEAKIVQHNAEMPQKEDDELARILSERLALLFAHYEIQDTNNYVALSMALAVDHVPGFSIKWQATKLEHGDHGAVVCIEPTGRKSEWGIDRVSKLFDDVEKTKRNGRLTDKGALQSLIRNNSYWRTPSNHRGTVEGWLKTLANHLAHAKKVRIGSNNMMKQLEKIASGPSKKNPGNSGSI